MVGGRVPFVTLPPTERGETRPRPAFRRGRAHAFDDAGMAASMRANAFEYAAAPSEAKQELWELLNAGGDACFELTVECKGGDECKICLIGSNPDLVTTGEGTTFAEAWNTREVTFDYAAETARLAEKGASS
jgi:hypothetical protein